MNEQTIICGRFDNHIQFDTKNLSNSRIRIGSSNPNKLKDHTYIPISTDGNIILYEGISYEVRQFFEKISTGIKKNLIILTLKELDLILDALVDFDVSVSVFERKYPFFSHIKYISNPNKNYIHLTELLKYIHFLGIKGNSIGEYLSTNYLFKVERKLRYKNKLDSCFFFAYKGGYQEIFRLKEERKDRAVIALDFNSMYADCMSGEFLEPKSIKHRHYGNICLDEVTLDAGLYRVILEGAKSDFFNNFHPFKYVKLNKSFYFRLENGQSIEVLLFGNEIEFYKKYFTKVKVIEGFYSKKSITHPLNYLSKKLFNKRKMYNAQRNNNMSIFYKHKLLMLHSSTNKKKFKTLYFNSLEDILSYLSDNYMIRFPGDMSSVEKILTIQDGNYFKFWEHGNGFKMQVRDFEIYDSVYNISAQITANARMKVIKTIERFLSHNSVEICYSNVDSIHISILKTEIEKFLLNNHDLISNKIGDMKIESISEKGYWFDVGRYWLMSKGKVDLFKNALFNNKNTEHQFSKKKKLNFICKNNVFNYKKTAWISIYKAFSYHKKIDSQSIDKSKFIRYKYDEIKDLNVANDSYNREILKSKILKVDLLNKISTV